MVFTFLLSCFYLINYLSRHANKKAALLIKQNIKYNFFEKKEKNKIQNSEKKNKNDKKQKKLNKNHFLSQNAITSCSS